MQYFTSIEPEVEKSNHRRDDILILINHLHARLRTAAFELSTCRRDQDIRFRNGSSIFHFVDVDYGSSFWVL